MTRPIKGLWLFVLSVLGLFSGAASAATTSVLCNNNIQGDSTYAYAPGCIDVLAWSWGLTGTTTGGTGGGQEVSVANLQDFSFTKYIDSASDNLFNVAATQKMLTGIVEFRDYNSACGGGCTTPYLTIHMNHVRVTSQSMGGSDGDDRHTENVTLSFNEISYCFTTTANKGNPQCFAFNKTLNQSIPAF